MSAIRPALETLRILDNEQFMDKLAVAIHDATCAVQVLGKTAKISIEIVVSPLSKQNLTEPVITIEADINTKLPKPDASRAMFYIDGEGNPTTNQQRQRDLGLSIAGGEAHEQGAA